MCVIHHRRADTIFIKVLLAPSWGGVHYFGEGVSQEMTECHQTRHRESKHKPTVVSQPLDRLVQSCVCSRGVLCAQSQNDNKVECTMNEISWSASIVHLFFVTNEID